MYLQLSIKIVVAPLQNCTDFCSITNLRLNLCPSGGLTLVSLSKRDLYNITHPQHFNSPFRDENKLALDL